MTTDPTHPTHSMALSTFNRFTGAVPYLRNLTGFAGESRPGKGNVLDGYSIISAFTRPALLSLFDRRLETMFVCVLRVKRKHWWRVSTNFFAAI
ncbi:hypothetical protein [Ensifer sp. NM-2]|uniref:hypothetical protein n=1 Tax=Ensifer sp. NM-2 TaxID=2109730 RepID=UPI0011B20648|nr:hypothetical protein [Ensifer sp. NM-2]